MRARIVKRRKKIRFFQQRQTYLGDCWLLKLEDQEVLTLRIVSLSTCKSHLSIKFFYISLFVCVDNGWEPFKMVLKQLQFLRVGSRVTKFTKHIWYVWVVIKWDQGVMNYVWVAYVNGSQDCKREEKIMVFDSCWVGLGDHYFLKLAQQEARTP